MIKFLDLYGQYRSIQREIDRAIQDVIRDSAFVGGRYIAEFERRFAQYVDAEHCIGVGNGTDALEISIEALKLPPGEIIVPGNSFIASSEAVTRSGHRVVFADADPGCYTINAETVKTKLSAKTVAMMPVHLYGHPCDMDGLVTLAKERNLRIIEDCAQAHGAQYKGRTVGTFGDVATFSFYPGKNLGAYGDAGAITTNDAKLATRIRKIANHGRLSKYNHDLEGRNSRLDGLQAGILNAKLEHLEAWNERRIAVADLYLRGLQGIGEVILPVRKPWARAVYHLFVVRTPRRDELKTYLASREIETGIHYPIALPKLLAYEYLGQSSEPLLVNGFDTHLLSLPIGEHLCDADVQRVIQAIREFFTA